MVIYTHPNSALYVTVLTVPVALVELAGGLGDRGSSRTYVST